MHKVRTKVPTQTVQRYLLLESMQFTLINEEVGGGVRVVVRLEERTRTAKQLQIRLRISSCVENPHLFQSEVRNRRWYVEHFAELRQNEIRRLDTTENRGIREQELQVSCLFDAFHHQIASFAILFWRSFHFLSFSLLTGKKKEYRTTCLQQLNN